MTREQLDYFSECVKEHFGDDKTAMNAAHYGLMWANEQNEKKLAALRSQIEILQGAYDTAKDHAAAIGASNANLLEALKIVMDGFSHIGAGKNSKSVLYVAREDWAKAYSALESTKPDPLYAAAPEMLELLRNIAYPRRGSDAETWGIEHAAHEAAQLLARIEAAENPA